ncbi:hypothetical protein PUN28_003257 [Cardiocondyla obscurior]|uniref:Uncharacterized protein n=1 Tax=Cardiocondyla obscurior TaxID=286306 RepID=A0AAW2GLD8_9HYME
MSVRPRCKRTRAQSTPRESDLGNFCRRSCVLRSLSACQLLSRRNGKIVVRISRSVLPAGDAERRRRRWKIQGPRKTFEETQLTKKLPLYGPLSRETSTEPGFRNDLFISDYVGNVVPTYDETSVEDLRKPNDIFIGFRLT